MHGRSSPRVDFIGYDSSWDDEDKKSQTWLEPLKLVVGDKTIDVIVRNEEVRGGWAGDLNGGEIMSFIFNMQSLKYRQGFEELA